MDFNKQVQRMIAFIDQEGDEKSVEIESKTEEVVNSSLGNTVNQERIKINNYYSKIESIVEKQRTVQVSLLASEARMRILQHKERRLEALFGEVYFNLKRDVGQPAFYKDFFMKLVIQSLCIMMEKNIGIRILRRDKKLIKELIPQIRDQFEQISKLRVRFEVDGRLFLDEECLGGIIMYAQRGSIKVENTIRSRLSLVRNNVASLIRYSLFGTNPHRRFMD